MPQTLPLPATSPLDVLAQRARYVGYEPWLFYRDGWDWIWRSWAQVADHVARGAEALRTASPTASLARGSHSVGYADAQDPDSIAIGLAIRAAGRSALPICGGPKAATDRNCDAWAEVENEDADDAAEDRDNPEGLEPIALPTVIDALDRTPLRPLVLGATQGSIGTPDLDEIDTAQLMAATRSLEDRAAAPEQRSIVCATPNLEPVAARLLETWALIRGAAWVLEPEPAAFLATILWARPTVVWTQATELKALASKLKTRQHRRQSRLSTVVVVGDGKVEPEPWRSLRIELIQLDEFLTGL